jgi:hypothetical protein
VVRDSFDASEQVRNLPLRGKHGGSTAETAVAGDGAPVNESSSATTSSSDSPSTDSSASGSSDGDTGGSK